MKASTGRQPPPIAGQQVRPTQPGPTGPPQPGFPNAAQMRGGNTTNMMGRLMGAPSVGGHVPPPVPNGIAQFPLPQSAQAPQQPTPSPLNIQSTGQGTPQSLGLAPTMDLLTSIPGTQPDKNVLELDMQGIKRKLEGEEDDGKRSRQKTGRFFHVSLSHLVLKNLADTPEARSVRLVLVLPVSPILTCKLISRHSLSDRIVTPCLHLLSLLLPPPHRRLPLHKRDANPHAGKSNTYH
jgi:hypothetical protein